ncbi:uncharacterized protein PAC_00837 [Phialocephala subalpina]|uniref:PIB1-phosphatidylinositol(3)-phosphate binding protein n=1 Tax=Phialocephala subalpina TaxID=576137 RepID=A0A1L7WDV1_9HELO|nr:uncharacterized protein PAC_00837 [Phialocephala subalpina]
MGAEGVCKTHVEYLVLKMDDAGPSNQASHYEGANGVDRPLPPLPDPDPELDLYSGGDESRPEASLPHASANIGGNENEEIYENQGQSSRSELQLRSEEVASSERNFSDIKGGGSTSTHASEQLAGPARQSESPSHLSRTRSNLNPPQNNDLQPSPNLFTQAQTSSERPQNNAQSDEMPPLGEDGRPLSRPGHVRSMAMDTPMDIAIRPGTVNYNGQTSPQYRVLPGYEGAMLPRWQPDEEVTACPICGSVFTMFNRKHHCRKCGKVVCAACSPHRITIPSEYIVKPPVGVGASPPRASRPLYESMNSLSLGESSIERGERVRLCNPCVPDPNTAPPQVAPPPYSGPSIRNERSVRPDDVLPRFAEYRAVPIQNNPPLFVPDTGFARQQNAASNIRRGVEIANNTRINRVASNSSQRRPDPGSWQRSQANLGAETIYSSTAQQPNPNLPHSYYYNPTQRDLDQTRALEGIDRERRRHGFVGIDPRSTPSPVQQPTPQPAPRRVVPEEDICPVCGHEYPAAVKVSARLKEEHIQTCIEDQLQRGQGHTHTTPAVVSSTPQHSGPRIRSSTQSRRGMTKYTATARDAVAGEECQICLDDFLPSQDLALLTCFCKYHADCILGWWNEGSGHHGKCPTHDHGL